MDPLQAHTQWIWSAPSVAHWLLPLLLVLAFTSQCVVNNTLLHTFVFVPFDKSLSPFPFVEPHARSTSPWSLSVRARPITTSTDSACGLSITIFASFATDSSYSTVRTKNFTEQFSSLSARVHSLTLNKGLYIHYTLSSTESNPLNGIQRSPRSTPYCALDYIDNEKRLRRVHKLHPSTSNLIAVEVLVGNKYILHVSKGSWACFVCVSKYRSDFEDCHTDNSCSYFEDSFDHLESKSKSHHQY